ncbi:MAG: tRNA lysidine(34) synthetase TilS [Ignavibacteriae bacterium]|nr:tRNA lysidine(34) synthetase TilS [Ignavibacteriota bacterium]NOG97828.1 tRNA lysidine(34) synthetase TilS [Ignavibacteriota bacterium]
MKTTEQKIIKFIDREGLIEQGDSLLIAFSGGPDSVFLFHFLIKFKKRFKVNLAACHVNHNLRGRQSDDDAEFCKAVCAEFSIPFFEANVDVKNYAAEKGLSIEEAARNLRYNFFSKIASENSCNKIVTAHNKDDNTETVLLNLFKGTGLTGLSGIPIRRDNIIRPLLCLDKAEILEYLKADKLAYRIDKSNFQNDFKRNFLRNKIISKIKDEINPSLDDAIFNSSQIFKNSDKVLNTFIESISGKYFSGTDETLHLDLKLIDDYNDEILGEALKYNLLKEFNHTFNFDDYLKLKELADHQTGKKVILSKNIEAYKERGAIVFVRSIKNKKFVEQKIKADQQIEFNGRVFGINEVKNKKQIKLNSDEQVEFICADDLSDEFTLRRWKAGDKFIPLGMNNFKKVSDFLNEQQVPAYKKKEQLLLTNRNNIVWVIGLRIDNRIRYSDKCKKTYKIWMR